ncbi:MAG: DmsC/YnfH family molybdoenzyme membrane anchor subunit [Bacteroidales bacterium]|nr:DmsC/YnfH family molybdoenzyme membrane anchor subunit [Bacteroidales bacterium]
MEKYNLSLALFTWLTQASVGLLIMRAIYRRISTAGERREISGHYMLFTSLVILVAGLLFSFAHLNYPRNAFNAINNIGSSWMSREILAEVILLTVLLLWYIINRFRIKRIPQSIPETVAIITGLLLVYLMIRTYMLPGLNELNHPSFPLSFIITTFLAGTAATYFFTKNNDLIPSVKFKMLFTVLFYVSLVNYFIFRLSNNDFKLFDLYSLIYLAAIILSSPSIYATIKNKNGISDVIFLNLAIISDFLYRVYSLTYTNPSL